MKLIWPHSGPDSYDFRTDGQIVTMAVSCARRTGTGVAAAATGGEGHRAGSTGRE